MSAPSSNPEEEGDSGPPEGCEPIADEDLDSDVGTIFSDEENGKKLSEDEEEEGELVSDEESGSSLSSDSEDGSEKCPICLQRITDQEIGSPEMCEHQFCLRCITAWSKKMATCPIDRKFFSTIIVKKQLNGEVVRIEEVKFANAQNNDEQYDSDPTFCEVCGRCDREDRLLLCDGCDLGYHLECLDPPLDFIPIEDWYCPNCVLQGLNLDEEPAPAPAPIPAPSSPSRSRPSRIPRTLQNERILQSIDSIDPVELDNIVASVAAGVGVQFPFRRTSLRATRTRTKKSGTRKYRKRKSGTATTTGSGGRRKRRSRRKTRKRRRVAVDKKPNTARGRIAHHLGIMPPLPGQVYVGLPPACRSAGSSSSTSTSGTSNAINTLRYSAGITPLRMFGAPNDLSDLVDSWSDDEGPLASAARFAPAHQPFGASLKGPAEVVAGPSNSTSGSCDVLGLILKKQYIFLNDKNVKITRDGTLVPSLSSTNLPDVATSLTSRSSKNTSTVTSPSLDTPSSSPSRYSSGSLTVAVCGLANGQESTQPSQTSNANAAQQNSGGSQDVRCGGESDSGSFIVENSGGANQGNSAGNQNVSFSEQSGFNLSDYWGTQQPSNQRLDEDDFDIYSDIEEQPQDTEKTDSSLAKTSSTTATSGFPLASPVADTSSRRTSFQDSSQAEDHDSELDMVIDEDEIIKSAQLSLTTAPQSQSQLLTKNVPKDPETVALPVASKTQNPEEDQTIQDDDKLSESPISIPMPPSPPPDDLEEEEVETEEKEKEEDCSHPREYDPSEPLNSGASEDEEEEASKKNVENKPKEEEKSGTASINKTPFKMSPSKPMPAESSTDLTAIPIPPPDEGGRRPAIHFSIPKRHNLLSLSSLMKRQKGHVRKETKPEGSAVNFQSEISKVFGTFGQPEENESKTDEEENLPKISLVAEIFGSDEDDEEEGNGTSEIPAIPLAGQDLAEDKLTAEETVAVADSAIDVTSGRWKTVSEEPTPETPQLPVPAAETTMPNNAEPECKQGDDTQESPSGLQERGSEEEPEIIEIVTLNIPPRSHHPRRLFGGPHDVETISDTDDSDIEVIDIRSSSKAKENTTGKSRGNRSRSRSESPPRRRDRKRRHSSSSSESFFEEGEIVDGNKRRRRGDRKRRVKKRRLSKEKERPVKSSSGLKERNSGAELHSNISSDDEGKAGDDSVEWKKPKKHSDRNYRGGKLKPGHDDKQREVSPSHRHRRKESSSSPDKRVPQRFSKAGSEGSWQHDRRNSRSGSSNKSNRSPVGARRFRRRASRSPHRVAHSRSPSRSPEPIKPRSSHVSKGRTSRSRSRERVQRRRERRRSLSRSRSPSNISKRRPSKYARAAEALRLKRKSKLKRINESKAIVKAKRKAKERLREREKRKALESKSKVEEKPTKAKPKAPKEKVEKRKRKREKSVSPVKAIVADGDSIVVSLSFQKDTEHAKSSTEKASASKSNKKLSSKRPTDSAKHKERSSATKPPSVNKKLDLGTEDLSSNSESGSSDNNLARDKEIGASKVSSSGDGSGRSQSRYENEKSYTTSAAGSKSSGKHDDSGEMQGDSLVTSTRDSLEPSTIAEDDCTNSTTSPVHLKPNSESTKLAAQNVTSSAHSPRIQGTSTLPSTQIAQQTLPGAGLGQPSTPTKAGNSVGQKSSSTGNSLEALPPASSTAPMPTTSTQSQSLRYPPTTSTNLFNPVLATVASALLAARNQTPPGTMGVLSRQNTTPVKNPNSRKRNQPFSGGDGSPVSPNSSDGDDLFEPPTEHVPGSSKKAGPVAQNKPVAGTMASIFDTLFGCEPAKSMSRPDGKSSKTNKSGGRPTHRKAPKRDPPAFTQPSHPCDNEDVPASAVELSVQEKLLKKLNRQERVVEEVKLCLKPHYIKKHVDKEEYKEILRRAVPKICHSKTGEINPFKIRELVEAYVRKFRHNRKM